MVYSILLFRCKSNQQKYWIYFNMGATDGGTICWWGDTVDGNWLFMLRDWTLMWRTYSGNKPLMCKQMIDVRRPIVDKGANCWCGRKDSSCGGTNRWCEGMIDCWCGGTYRWCGEGLTIDVGDRKMIWERTDLCVGDWPMMWGDQPMMWGRTEW